MVLILIIIFSKSAVVSAIMNSLFIYLFNEISSHLLKWGLNGDRSTGWGLDGDNSTGWGLDGDSSTGWGLDGDSSTGWGLDGDNSTG